ncbi:MAG: hypothetical protein K2R98_27590 [Gemmataceae bacterium]|nr:hypothetical protein [Gemmataceae bacterium]
MSTAIHSPEAQATPLESNELLQRILVAVEEHERKRWVEIACAVVLSLATMASAWCAYQATLWGGVQTFRLASAAKASRESGKNSVTAMQLRASMFAQYVEARLQGRKDVEAFLYPRFRPEMRVALDAWLQSDPFNNPNAPSHPLRMAEYLLQAETEAGRHSLLEEQYLASAAQANRNSDNYVLLTVMFASVLFVGGITGTISAPWLRKALGVLALAFFVGIVVFLATMPICRD